MRCSEWFNWELKLIAQDIIQILLIVILKQHQQHLKLLLELWHFFESKPSATSSEVKDFIRTQASQMMILNGQIHLSSR